MVSSTSYLLVVHLLFIDGTIRSFACKKAQLADLAGCALLFSYTKIYAKLLLAGEDEVAALSCELGYLGVTVGSQYP